MITRNFAIKNIVTFSLSCTRKSSNSQPIQKVKSRLFSSLRSIAQASSYRFLCCVLRCVTFSQKLFYNYPMSGHIPYYLQETLRDFQESFRRLSGVFQESFRSLSGVFQESFRSLLGVFQEFPWSFSLFFQASLRSLIIISQESYRNFLGVFWQSLRLLSGVSQESHRSFSVKSNL